MILTKNSPELKGLSDQALRELVGGKAAGLVQMAQAGINVPNFVIIPTAVCVEYMKNPGGVMEKVNAALPEIKKALVLAVKGKAIMPLVSVRSGARISMPGMMDTILNVGLDDSTFQYWQEKIGTECATNSYHRLAAMYGSVVHGIDKAKFEGTSLTEAWALVAKNANNTTPQADDQIFHSIQAVFDSWMNPRAKVYRELNNIPEDWGTAVVIQEMVFGNFNDQSATGVLFTRDPDSGNPKMVGEYLVNAQGEDVVDGSHTPLKIDQMLDWNLGLFNELAVTAAKLEKLKKEVQDIEFTVQDGKLYILQTRNAKRSAGAAVRIAVDMINQGLITIEEANQRVSARDLDLADMPVIDPDYKVEADYKGIPACSGAVIGEVVKTAAEAVKAKAEGRSVILVTKETTPDDIAGMHAAVGILTMNGGSTSHAAVVARAMNRACVVGLGEQLGAFPTGKVIALDGATGQVWMHEVPVVGGLNVFAGLYRNLLVGSGALLCASAPKHHVDRLVLDLSAALHLEDAEIISLVAACKEKCKELTVLVGNPIDEAAQYLSVFYSPKEIIARVQYVRDLLDKANPGEFKVMGWESKTHSAIDCAVADDIVSLVLVNKSGVLLGTSKIGGSKYKAYKKVMDWLAKDGITLSAMNVKGGIAAHTVHVHG